MISESVSRSSIAALYTNLQSIWLEFARPNKKRMKNYENVFLLIGNQIHLDTKLCGTVATVAKNSWGVWHCNFFPMTFLIYKSLPFFIILAAPAPAVTNEPKQGIPGPGTSSTQEEEPGFFYSHTGTSISDVLRSQSAPISASWNSKL